VLQVRARGDDAHVVRGLLGVLRAQLCVHDELRDERGERGACSERLAQEARNPLALERDRGIEPSAGRGVPVLVQPEEGDNVFVRRELLGREDGENALYDAAVERSWVQILTIWPMGGQEASDLSRSNTDLSDNPPKSGSPTSPTDFQRSHS
jgi:hypothetical protein